LDAGCIWVNKGAVAPVAGHARFDGIWIDVGAGAVAPADGVWCPDRTKLPPFDTVVAQFRECHVLDHAKCDGDVACHWEIDEGCFPAGAASLVMADASVACGRIKDRKGCGGVNGGDDRCQWYAPGVCHVNIAKNLERLSWNEVKAQFSRCSKFTARSQCEGSDGCDWEDGDDKEHCRADGPAFYQYAAMAGDCSESKTRSDCEHGWDDHEQADRECGWHWDDNFATKQGFCHVLAWNEGTTDENEDSTYTGEDEHEQLPGKHGAPRCMHNCFVHYAWQEKLPKGKEPTCNLWTEYLYGDQCGEDHLQPRCGQDPEQTRAIAFKCVDRGCEPESCMGRSDADRLKMRRLLAPHDDGSCNMLRYVQNVSKCRTSQALCAESVRAAGSDLALLKRTFCNASNTTLHEHTPGACHLFGDCVRAKLEDANCLEDDLGRPVQVQGPLAQFVSTGTDLAYGYRKFKNVSDEVCRTHPGRQVAPCRNRCADSFRTHMGLGPAAKVTCDYYRDYVFGPKCHGNTPALPSGGSHGGSGSGSGSYGGSYVGGGKGGGLETSYNAGGSSYGDGGGGAAAGGGLL
jgi:hypothetical protein